MVPDWALKFLGPEGVADRDPRSSKPMAWGRRVVSEIPESLFNVLRGTCDVACVYPDWFVVERRVEFADLVMAHGPVKLVGLGPAGGFKWVRFEDGSTWGHSSLRTEAQRQASMNPRIAVRCDKDGNERGTEPRVPRRAIGRSFSRARAATGGRKGR